MNSGGPRLAILVSELSGFEQRILSDSSAFSIDPGQTLHGDSYGA